VITEAGNHDKVAGLVYVAAFQPDTGESPMDLTKKMPPATKAIKATEDGIPLFRSLMFHADFAADVPGPPSQFHGDLAGNARCKGVWRSHLKGGVDDEA
jgi:hypothetical protein